MTAKEHLMKKVIFITELGFWDLYPLATDCQVLDQSQALRPYPRTSQPLSNFTMAITSHFCSLSASVLSYLFTHQVTLPQKRDVNKCMRHNYYIHACMYPYSLGTCHEMDSLLKFIFSNTNGLLTCYSMYPQK